ncbi:hypothetical protein ED733_004750 [Metarhizium rileyi]|uniref:Heterokaryon incompatibility domain-containing protein n=1 Tax=Metarhizium rileyi (strain RCEF 4871) TaxID=1649241 RepID=A0A5C6G5E3_METRR|nr:hypothetical protein ED733_004750 [Metarhizium rileyi]
MDPCEYCDRIPARLFSVRRDEQSDYDHQPTVEALQASATGGCQGCRLIRHAIENSTSEHAGEYALPGTWKPRDRVRLSSTKFGWQVVRIGWTEAGHFRGFVIPPDWEDWEVVKPVSSAEAAEGASVDHLAYESRLIRRWSKDCLEHHNGCSRGTGFLPTRLIDVGTEAYPKLALVLSEDVESADKRYIALSHCWGLTMPDAGKTTTRTLNDRLSSVLEDFLPRTFQDFVQNTRRLGVPYVWIDSLCIVQDSRDDWEKEAAQMADVYSNAHLTMAASGSADGRGGCQVVDGVRSYGPVDIACRVDMDSSSSPSSTGGARKRFRLWSRDTYPVGQILATDPLTKRGWTLQERELSPRVVHYCRDTIRWECCESRATIEFPWSDRASFDVGRLLDGGSFTRPTLIGVPHSGSEPVDSLTKQRLSWFELVGRYTSRSLTKQTDILPAFSGIARSIGRSRSDEYYAAGLWKSYLGHCLLWASDWHVGRGFRQHSRPADYLAPSWSWASVKGPICYLSWINGYWHSFNADPDPVYVPRLVGVSLEASSDPYGALKAGTLTVEGKVGMAVCKQEAYAAVSKDHLRVTFTAGHQDRQNLLGMSGGRLDRIGQIRHDVPLCSDCSPVGKFTFLWLLCCMNSDKTADGKTSSTFAIALRRVDDPEGQIQMSAANPLPTRFRRVGIAWDIDASFWDTAAVNMTLTMV